jgi:hypothetical protein
MQYELVSVGKDVHYCQGQYTLHFCMYMDSATALVTQLSAGWKVISDYYREKRNIVLYDITLKANNEK